jgi:pimeloyl-ACP methyl ester carboxylesterase
MDKVISKDGTSIAFDKTGQGPAVIIVPGALAMRAVAAPVAAGLSPNFTVFTYDRRGRGDSSDTAPYAVEREIEDLQALIAQAGGKAFMFGHSSGSVLALKAARRLAPSIPRLALYEPPVLVDSSRPPFTPAYLAHLTELVVAGRHREAVSYYFTAGLLVSDEALAGMQKAPFWPNFEAIAPTLVYDSLIVEDTMSGKPLSSANWASVTMPTLVMNGGLSPAFMRNGAESLAAVLPNAQHRHFPDQDHGVSLEIIVPVLVEFFEG